MEPVTSETAYLSSWIPPYGPMSFAPMAASSRIDGGDNNLSKTIIWPFLRFTFLWIDLIVLQLIFNKMLALLQLFPMIIGLSIFANISKFLQSPHRNF